MEAVVKGIDLFFDKTLNWQRIAAAVVGFVFALAGQLNILVAAGLPFESNLGYFFSYFVFAMILMRGSGALNDLFKKFIS